MNILLKFNSFLNFIFLYYLYNFKNIFKEVNSLNNNNHEYFSFMIIGDFGIKIMYNNNKCIYICII